MEICVALLAYLFVSTLTLVQTVEIIVFRLFFWILLSFRNLILNHLRPFYVLRGQYDNFTYISFVHH